MTKQRLAEILATLRQHKPSIRFFINYDFDQSGNAVNTFFQLDQ